MNEKRNQIIRNLVSNGSSFSEIGELLGISKQRVHQVCTELGIQRPKLISRTELDEKLRKIAKENRLDPMRKARMHIENFLGRDVGELRKALRARLPITLMEEFKTVPGPMASNLRAAISLYTLVFTGKGSPRLQAISNGLVIERRSQALKQVGIRVTGEMWQEFSNLPGIVGHNMERALRLFMLVMKKSGREDATKIHHDTDFNLTSF